MAVTPKPANGKQSGQAIVLPRCDGFCKADSRLHRGWRCAGDSQGGGSPSCGGSRVFCGVGGTRPPRLSSEGKRERGDQLPCCRRLIQASCTLAEALVRQLRGPHLRTCP